MKLVKRLTTSAAALGLATVGIVGLGATAAHAADSYYCGTSVTYGDVTVTGCIHLGGNGYWQPYVVVDDSQLHQVTGSQWINSNGSYNDTSSFNSTVDGSAVVWGGSTNWRVSCYVQAQAAVIVDGTSVGRVYSPSEEVC
ncbi:hypothetical protein [Streptacidiphilus fuscans]|uniref:Secreted protein n=1 Tax=Streptacidiphilus fuscans TaxID=2789292 RepID=A0A931AXQ7_9ACTN|nr:hypothetical protein [Streptacidiphilus fuscans]MBF9066789.1 hypothetical protein [Streptacidiphilus fuscans]